MSALIGKGANQVPTNGLLGSMAFQNADNYVLNVPVAARYQSTSGQSITNTNTVFKYETAAGTDTHSAYNTTTGVYTVPIAGRYFIGASFLTNVVNLGSGQIIQIQIRVNGAVIKYERTIAGSAITNYGVSVFDAYYLSVGDTVDIQVYAYVATTATTAQSWNVFTISKVSN